MNTVLVRTFATLSATFILTSCNAEKLDLTNYNETLYFMETKEHSVAAKLPEQVFLLAGKYEVILEDFSMKRMKPGEMFDFDKQKLYRFSILELINKYPEMKTPTTEAAAKSQKI